MKELTTSLTQLRSQITGIVARRSFEAEQLEHHRARMLEIEAIKADLVKTLTLIDQTIGVVSANGIGRIETTVTEGLRLVFNDPTLAFRILKAEGTRGSSYYIEGGTTCFAGAPVSSRFAARRYMRKTQSLVGKHPKPCRRAGTTSTRTSLEPGCSIASPSAPKDPERRSGTQWLHGGRIDLSSCPFSAGCRTSRRALTTAQIIHSSLLTRMARSNPKTKHRW